jgi:hypothetical protein
MSGAGKERLTKEMFKSLANVLKGKREKLPPEPDAPFVAAVMDENVPIYQQLAMTDELREALFPTTTRMVSTIFERPTNTEPLAARSWREQNDANDVSPIV